MQVAENKVVTFDYTLKDDQGQVLDSSEGAQPLSYLHGQRQIIAGLERAMEGKSVNDEFQVSIPPAEGYGERNEDLRQPVPRTNFSGIDKLEVGMQFRVAGEEAIPMVVTIVELGEENVIVDGNHAMAGLTLHFDVAVRDIRDATDEEISHGHAHGRDGHHHEH